MNLRINILALDDDREELELMRVILENVQVDTFQFFTDENAFLSALSTDVHIAIIDNYLKGAAKGFKIMQEVKKKSPKAKIIIVSGSTEPKMIIDYLNEGVYKFLDKNDKHYQVKLYDFVHRAISEVREVLELIEFLQGT